MDFYGNHNTIDWQVRERIRELRRDAMQARIGREAAEDAKAGTTEGFTGNVFHGFREAMEALHRRTGSVGEADAT